MSEPAAAPAALPESRDALYRSALVLAGFTIFYNLIEGVAATVLGFHDETLALFGFGLDSFIEVLSAVGVAHMVIRTRRQPDEKPDKFERNALRITAVSFFLLTAGLLITAAINLVQGHKPEDTFWGVVIAVLSIAVMLWLIRGKTRVGHALNSAAILADAGCTKACVAMSIILLLSSGIYTLTGWGYLDTLGAAGLAVFAFREGRESWQNAKAETLSCCGHDH